VGRWANAQIIYTTVAEESLALYEEVEDEGQISGIIDECATGLVECLEAQTNLSLDEQLNDAEREALLCTLFTLWRRGEHYGGIGADVPEVISHHVKEDERARVEGWLRQEIRPGQDFASKWQNRKLLAFLMTLRETAHVSSEDLLEEYRKAGLYKELTEKLLQLNRKDETLATGSALLTDPGDVIWFAEQLGHLGGPWPERALNVVETRLKGAEQASEGRQPDLTSVRTIDTYQRWLGERYSAYGRTDQTLKMELARFQAGPSDATYRSVQSAAQLAGLPQDLWETLRPRLLTTLEQQGNWGALISIYLHEGVVDDALSALAELESATGKTPAGSAGAHRSTLSDYQLRVAKAAEEEYPEDAIRLYRSMAEKLINARGRENYKLAAGYFTRVRLLYQQQGRKAEWNAYISILRNKHKSLRALKEELDKQGL
jgi:hypothetical protein